MKALKISSRNFKIKSLLLFFVLRTLAAAAAAARVAFCSAKKATEKSRSTRRRQTLWALFINSVTITRWMNNWWRKFLQRLRFGGGEKKANKSILKRKLLPSKRLLILFQLPNNLSLSFFPFEVERNMNDTCVLCKHWNIVIPTKLPAVESSHKRGGIKLYFNFLAVELELGWEVAWNYQSHKVRECIRSLSKTSSSKYSTWFQWVSWITPRPPSVGSNSAKK